MMDGFHSEQKESTSSGVANLPSLVDRPSATWRDDLAVVYRKAKELAIRHDVFRMIQVAEIEGIKQLTICNLWRIERHPDHRVCTYNFNLEGNFWQEDNLVHLWPDVTLFPIRKSIQAGWWRHFIKAAIWKLLNASGFAEILKVVTVPFEPEDFDLYSGTRRKTHNVGKMGHCLVSRFIGHDGLSDKSRWRGGVLKPKRMEPGARALRAAIWGHLIDREVFSAMCTITGKFITFHDYMRYAKHREGLLKVAREHRNLLPLLPSFDGSLWSRDDLFSRHLWVKDGREATLLDHPPFSYRSPEERGDPVEILYANKAPGEGFASFDVPAAWRWISRASSVVVRDWETFGGGLKSQKAIVTNLALANVSEGVPVIAQSYVMRQSSSLARYGVSPLIQRLLRVFLLHSARLWKEKGYSEVRAWIKSGDASLTVILDYLQAEGFAQGQPDRQATWPSLKRRSDDWHRRIAIERMEEEFSGKKLLTWSSILGVTTIDGVVFTPLENSKALALEGYDLNHCVGSYAGRCHRGTYRVFAVRGADGVRSTLGIEVSGNKVHWDQHMGSCNAAVVGETEKAGHRLVLLYGRALAAGRKGQAA